MISLKYGVVHMKWSMAEEDASYVLYVARQGAPALGLHFSMLAPTKSLERKMDIAPGIWWIFVKATNAKGETVVSNLVHMELRPRLFEVPAPPPPSTET